MNKTTQGPPAQEWPNATGIRTLRPQQNQRFSPGLPQG